MKKIWYLLKCPEGSETDYVKECQEFTKTKTMQDIIHFQYQRMLRYGGSWHLENRTLLPGCIFLSEKRAVKLKECLKASLIPCEISQLKSLCSEENLIEMSEGVIKNGVPIVINGPLKGRECLIRRIDRHRRTAEIEVVLAGKEARMVVGLEIYEKQA